MKTTAAPRRARSAAAILFLSILFFTTLALAYSGAPVSATTLQDDEGPALLVGFHAGSLSPGAPLDVAALAPQTIAARPLFAQSGAYHDPVLDATLSLEHIYRLELAPGADMQAIMAELAQRHDVAFVEPDYIAREVATPDDPRYGEQWGLQKINAATAWDVRTGGALIALIDAGIDDDHPDLAGRLWTNPGEIPGNGIDDDNNGFADDVNGWNFFGANAYLADSTGHGTQVAGLVAAAGNNGVGISGVCWSCQLMVLKVIQPGGNANYSDIAAAIDYAAAKGADVINLSLGGNADSAALRAAVAAASNSVLVAGAGNDNNSIPFYPAAYEDVLAVAGTDADDLRVSSSNYGAWVDVSAPGSDVLTTFDGGGYGSSAGTSLAAPFASGAAALLHAQFGWSPALIRAHLLQTAAPIEAANPGYNGQLGAGRLDGGAALTTPAAPDLVVQTVHVDGRSGGQPEPGSTVDLQLTLTNDWAPTGPLQATLSSNDTYATVVQNSASFDAVDTYGTAQNSTPLRITVGNNAPYGHNLSLRLTLRQDGAVVQTIPVRVTVAQQVVNVSGLISSDTTWSGDRVYRLTGNVVVQAGVTLTVEAGARVEAEVDKVLRVQGILVVEGTEDTPVVFTSASLEPAAGDWIGVSASSNGRLQMSHCEVSYASYGVHLQSSSRFNTIVNCTIQNNNTGIYAWDWDTSLSVTRSRLIYNDSAVITESDVSIQDSEISYNRSGIQGGILIAGNLIHNNRGLFYDEWGPGFGLRVRTTGDLPLVQVYSNTITANSIGIIVDEEWIPTHTVETQANNFQANLYYNVILTTPNDVDFSNNWWGTTSLDAISDSVYDFSENSERGIANIHPILTAPSAVAPTYFYDLDVSPDTTIGIQEATLDLKFSATMDDSSQPLVTFRTQRRYEAGDGDFFSFLPSPRDVAIDVDGSVWIATEASGLLHYGGDGWSQIRPADYIPNLEGNAIWDIFIDRQGVKWVTTMDGLARLDGNSWQLQMDGAVGSTERNVIAADSNGAIWFASESELAHYSGNAWQRIQFNDVGLSGFRPRTLAVAGNDLVWMAGDDVIVSYDGSQWRHFDQTNSSLPSFQVQSLAIDQQNHLWLAVFVPETGEYVLYEFDGVNFNKHHPSSGVIRFLLPENDGSMLAIVEGKVLRYDDGEWHVQGALTSPDSTGVTASALARDSGGALWIVAGHIIRFYETVANGNGIWLNPTTYRVTHAVTAAMPRGEYDIRVGGAFDARGRETPPMTLPAFTVDYAGEVADGSAPPRPSLSAVGVEGDASGVSARWSASDPDSQIIAYRYAIGTTHGGREIVNWTTTNANTTRLSRNGLGFVEGQTYYFSLQAQNSGGLWSPSAIGSFVSGQGDYENYLPAFWGR